MNELYFCRIPCLKKDWFLKYNLVCLGCFFMPNPIFVGAGWGVFFYGRPYPLSKNRHHIRKSQMSNQHRTIFIPKSTS